MLRSDIPRLIHQPYPSELAELDPAKVAAVAEHARPWPPCFEVGRGVTADELTHLAMLPSFWTHLPRVLG